MLDLREIHSSHYHPARKRVGQCVCGPRDIVLFLFRLEELTVQQVHSVKIQETRRMSEHGVHLCPTAARI